MEQYVKEAMQILSDDRKRLEEENAMLRETINTQMEMRCAREEEVESLSRKLECVESLKQNYENCTKALKALLECAHEDRKQLSKDYKASLCEVEELQKMIADRQSTIDKLKAEKTRADSKLTVHFDGKEVEAEHFEVHIPEVPKNGVVLCKDEAERDESFKNVDFAKVATPFVYRLHEADMRPDKYCAFKNQNNLFIVKIDKSWGPENILKALSLPNFFSASRNQLAHALVFVTEDDAKRAIKQNYTQFYERWKNFGEEYKEKKEGE